MKASKSLKYQGHKLNSTEYQIEILNSEAVGNVPLFQDKLAQQQMFPLTASKLDTLQVNVGYMCNQTCQHCHVDAGPDRKEIMTKPTMKYCLDALKHGNFDTLDLTGGAPEMHPDFKWFVEEANKQNIKTIVRSNLTILVANKKYHDLPDFFKQNNVEITSSLPFYTKSRTDAQRGQGVFQSSIKALKMLNEVGYGLEKSDLKLNLVYNPTDSFLSGDQLTLQNQYKKKLKEDFDIHFNELFTITNMPINRFLDYLQKSDNLEDYMSRLLDAYNPNAVPNLMCKNTVSVSWDGFLYDCDFNQMLDIKVNAYNHIKNFNIKSLLNRSIQVNQHCFGCTAGAGSSCGGALS